MDFVLLCSLDTISSLHRLQPNSAQPTTIDQGSAGCYRCNSGVERDQVMHFGIARFYSTNNGHLHWLMSDLPQAHREAPQLALSPL